jgi:hypothetical protein
MIYKEDILMQIVRQKSLVSWFLKGTAIKSFLENAKANLRSIFTIERRDVGRDTN